MKSFLLSHCNIFTDKLGIMRRCFRDFIYSNKINKNGTNVSNSYPNLVKELFVPQFILWSTFPISTGTTQVSWLCCFLETKRSRKELHTMKRLCPLLSGTQLVQGIGPFEIREHINISNWPTISSTLGSS